MAAFCVDKSIADGGVNGAVAGVCASQGDGLVQGNLVFDGLWSEW